MVTADVVEAMSELMTQQAKEAGEEPHRCLESWNFTSLLAISQAFPKRFPRVKSCQRMLGSSSTGKAVVSTEPNQPKKTKT
jgi:hypothetical protein